MTDLAAEGDRLHGNTGPRTLHVPFWEWAWENWPAIAAALRDAIYWRTAHAESVIYSDALRVRAETAEADADRLTLALRQEISRRYGVFIEADALRLRNEAVEAHPALAAHAAAVEGRPVGNPQPPARSHSTGTSGFNVEAS